MTTPTKNSARTPIRIADFGTLLATRRRGEDIALELPSDDFLELDFADVEVSSPSFLDEMMKVLAQRGVQAIRFLNTTKRTNESLRRLLSVAGEDGNGLPEVDYPQTSPGDEDGWES